MNVRVGLMSGLLMWFFIPRLLVVSAQEATQSGTTSAQPASPAATLAPATPDTLAADELLDEVAEDIGDETPLQTVSLWSQIMAMPGQSAITLGLVVILVVVAFVAGRKSGGHSGEDEVQDV